LRSVDKGNNKPEDISAKKIDDQLHGDRVTRTRDKFVYSAKIDDLPDGVFVELDEDRGSCWLLWCSELLKWEPAGYGERRQRPTGLEVTVLTPESTVRTIEAGYRPHVHHNK
jgi:hypothetical protein